MMNWWTVILIISGVWALIGFITVIIILKLKKVKPIGQKVINYLPQISFNFVEN